MPDKAMEFVFADYSKTLKKDNSAHFDYEVVKTDGTRIQFRETLTLPNNNFLDLDKDVLTKLLQSLHLISGVSYWKAFCPEKISIKSYSLTRKQADFWNTVYTKGLGEFFYKNKIDYKGLIEFPYEDGASGKQFEPSRLELLSQQENRTLLGIGGGKDSLLAAQLFKEGGIEFETCYEKNPLKEVVARSVSKNPIEIIRTVDPKLISLSKSCEVYNGHIPVSAIYAFIILLLGGLYGYKYLVVGNERSSNYGNVEYLGEMVNHQWSKSEEFENLFRDYVFSFISSDLVFFSLLRPLYEIEIARRFSSFSHYFNLFSSCNRNFKIINPQTDRKWCCECDKCAFIFCLFAAFLPRNRVVAIFGEDLYDKKSLLDTYRQLLGIRDVKPFECVGTPEEVVLAFKKAEEKGEYKESVVMNMFLAEAKSRFEPFEKIEKKLFSYGPDENIPSQFRTVFKINTI